MAFSIIYYMSTLALDLGTFNSVCVISTGRKKTLVSDNGVYLIPSCVRYSDDGEVAAVGIAALREYWKNTNVVRCVKRIFGHKMDTPEMSKYMRNCIAKVISGDDGYPRIQMPAFPNNDLTPDKVSADIIKYIVELAKKQTENEIEQLIVSIPAFFSQAQRARIEKVARDLKVSEEVTIVSEPVAAALYYAVVNKENSNRIMVVDFGGGTLDICIMDIEGNTFTTVSTGGDLSLGGDDITNDLRVFIEKKYYETNGRPLISFPKTSKKYPPCTEELKQRAEEAKLSLSQSDTTIVDCSLTVDYKELYDDSGDETGEITNEMEVTIFELNELLEDRLKRIVEVIEEVMHKGKTNINEIKKIIMVGGSSRLRAVQDMLRTTYKNKVEVAVDLDECVARGAWQASQYGQKDANVKLFDRIPDHYGTLINDTYLKKDRFQSIIPLGTRFPTDQVFKHTFMLPTDVHNIPLGWSNVGLFLSKDGIRYTMDPQVGYDILDATKVEGNNVCVALSIDRSGIIYAEITQTCDGRAVFEKQRISEVLTNLGEEFERQFA